MCSESSPIAPFKKEVIMQFKSFIIPVSNAAKSEAEMNAFLRSHKIISVSKELITNGENSFWSVLAQYIDDTTLSNEKLKGSIDYKELLSKEDFTLFSQLRDLRKKIAEEQKVPVFVIFTNEQLADIAQSKPKNLSALCKIQGIGKGKSEKYGETFLKALNDYAENEKEK